MVILVIIDFGNAVIAHYIKAGIDAGLFMSQIILTPMCHIAMSSRAIVIITAFFFILYD